MKALRKAIIIEGEMRSSLIRSSRLLLPRGTTLWSTITRPTLTLCDLGVERRLAYEDWSGIGEPGRIRPTLGSLVDECECNPADWLSDVRSSTSAVDRSRGLPLLIAERALRFNLRSTLLLLLDNLSFERRTFDLGRRREDRVLISRRFRML